MRNAPARTAAAAFGAALLALASLATGCAQTRDIAEVMTAPVGAADDDERAYDLGHRIGRTDAQRERPADPALHRARHDPATEKAFATGYRDGYAGRANRNGAPATRDWLYGRNDDPDR